MVEDVLEKLSCLLLVHGPEIIAMEAAKVKTNRFVAVEEHRAPTPFCPAAKKVTHLRQPLTNLRQPVTKWVSQPVTIKERNKEK
jgi:hypothetical protein